MAGGERPVYSLLGVSVVDSHGVMDEVAVRARRKKKLTRVGFEPTPGYPDEKPAEAGKLSLESHALDRSAILPCINYNTHTP